MHIYTFFNDGSLNEKKTDCFDMKLKKFRSLNMRKVPFIPQFNTTECGVCVVTMILHYFGAYYPIKSVRETLPSGRDGITILELINSLKEYGIEAKAFSGVIDGNTECELPAIISWEKNHYVILEKITTKFFGIVDSNIGRIRVPYDEFKDKYSGIVIMLSTTEDFVKLKKKIEIKKSFFSLIFSYKRQVFFLMLLCLLTKASSLAIPIVVRYLIDDMKDLLMKGSQLILLLVVILLNLIFLYAKGHCLSILNADIDREVSNKLVLKLLKVPYLFYDKKDNAEIFYALDNVVCVKKIYLESVVSCLFEIGAMVFIFCYLFKTSGTLFIVLLLLIPVILALLLTDEPIQRDAKLMAKQQGNLAGHQVEIVYSMLGIRAASLEKNIFRIWQDTYDSFYKMNKSYQIKLNAYNVMLSTLVTLSPIIILVIAVIYTQRGIITLGIAVTFYTMSDFLFSSLYSALSAIRTIRNNLISLERIDDIMQYEEEISFADDRDCIKLDGEIEIRNVSFSYTPNGNDILKGISCKIVKESKVALVGDSGAGKSTLLKVISRIYGVKNGEILYDGLSIENDVLGNIKGQIGYIAQDMWLMNKTIIENIMMGLTDISEEKVQEACKLVNIHEEIMNMPMKYQTIITETGKNVSGGQRQRILLARIILLNPKIILLDEATSALDIANEKQILSYFYKIRCTVIMITHRLELLKKCDNIIVMKNGKIIGQGKYDRLITESVYFRNLLK